MRHRFRNRSSGQPSGPSYSSWESKSTSGTFFQMAPMAPMELSFRNGVFDPHRQSLIFSSAASQTVDGSGSFRRNDLFGQRKAHESSIVRRSGSS